MLALALKRQLCAADQALRLRLWTAAAIAAPAIALWATWPRNVAEAAGTLAWTQLLVAIVVGAVHVGWRVAQFPKSRAAEFYLVSPVSDAEILAGQLGAGLLKSAAAVIAGGAPCVAALWGTGGLGLAEAAALLAVPVAAGWLAGMLLAVVAYETRRVRQWLERLALAGVVAYLLLFGLAGKYVLPWSMKAWAALTSGTPATASDAGDVLRFFNPFRLLGDVGRADAGLGDRGLAWRTAAIVGVLLALAAIGFWRLALRLRPHYLEENYGVPSARREFGRGVGENPLAWWTVRRVSRFRGNVNLYLAWCVTGLYSAWLLCSDTWPTWLAPHLLRRIEAFGGEAQLAAAALQLAVVGVAFLDGLWDSSLAQRLARMELLLTTPLSARQYAVASAAAGWTRGRGYILATLTLWVAAACAGRVTWPACLGLCLLSAGYIVLVFAVALRNFGRVAGDRAAVTWGLAISIGSPLLTWALFTAGLSQVAAATPLGAVFLLSLPEAAQRAYTGLDAATTWRIAAVAYAGYVGVAALLMRRTLAGFDQAVRTGFSARLSVKGA